VTDTTQTAPECLTVIEAAAKFAVAKYLQLSALLYRWECRLPSLPLINPPDFTSREFRHSRTDDWLRGARLPTPLNTQIFFRFRDSSSVRLRGCRWHHVSPRYLAAVRCNQLFWFDAHAWCILVASSHCRKCAHGTTVAFRFPFGNRRSFWSLLHRVDLV
jgi:hypothetical protein